MVRGRTKERKIITREQERLAKDVLNCAYNKLYEMAAKYFLNFIKRLDTLN
jgi:hypothetical protein